MVFIMPNKVLAVFGTLSPFATQSLSQYFSSLNSSSRSKVLIFRNEASVPRFKVENTFKFNVQGRNTPDKIPLLPYLNNIDSRLSSFSEDFSFDVS